MSQLVLVLIIILTIFVAIIFIGSIVAFNLFQRIRMNVEKAASDIDVLLKQRFDEVPQLVATCKGFMKHEKSIFVELTELRANFQEARGNQTSGQQDMGSLVALSSFLGGATERLYAMAEKYPELKSSEHLIRLSLRLSELEERIADRREYYNEAVSLYNARLSSFPEVLFTQIFGYAKKSTITIKLHEYKPHVPAHMKTILVDAVHTLFSPEGEPLEDVYDVLSYFPQPKIIITNAPRETFASFLEKEPMYTIFSLDRDPPKEDPRFFEIFLEYVGQDSNNFIYFDHGIKNVVAAKNVGILAYHFDHHTRNIEALENFLDDSML